MEDPTIRFKADCNNCDWTGPLRDTEAQAQRDLDDHKRQVQPMQHEGVILRVPPEPEPDL